MRKIRIAVAQFALVEGDIAENGKKARIALEQAGVAGADLVVLPELWLTGYPYRRLDELADQTPESLERVGALAKRLGFFVVGSWVEKGENGLLHNTAMIIDPEGRVRATYRKVHLFGPMKEDRCFAPGKTVTVADLGIGVVGLGLCYDLRFPELTRKLALAGAELIVFPSQWPAVRLGHFQTLLAARAIENQLFIAGVNRVGKSAATVFGGGSMVVGPRGEILAQFDAKEGLIAVELDLGEVQSARREISYLRDRVKEVDEFFYC